MSTIKSSTEHLTLNADGAGKEIKFQANGVEVSSISSAGVMTATSFAGDGSALTGITATTVDLGNWTVTEAAGVLKFATGGVDKMKLDASGNLTVVGDVTAFGTI
jgi:hypothetical protein